MDQVLSNINSLCLDALDEDWVQAIYHSEFLEIVDFPADYESALEPVTIHKVFQSLIKSINNWLSAESNGEEDKSWASLSPRVQHQRLLTVLAYYIDYGTKNVHTKEYRNNALLASRVYYSLLSIPGYNAYHIYHAQLFTHSLGCLSFPKEMCEKDDNYCNTKELTREVNSVIRELRPYVIDLRSVVEKLQLKPTDMNFEDILSNLVDIIGGAIVNKLNIDKIELANISQVIYTMIDSLLQEPDGEPSAVAIQLLFKCMLPKLVSASVDSRNANNLVRASYVTYSGLLLTRYDKAAVTGFTILLQHLCYAQDGLERAEVRAARVQLVVGLMSLLPRRAFRNTVKWLLQLTTTAKVPHRHIGMEILANLLSNEPEEVIEQPRPEATKPPPEQEPTASTSENKEGDTEKFQDTSTNNEAERNPETQEQSVNMDTTDKSSQELPGADPTQEVMEVESAEDQVAGLLRARAHTVPHGEILSALAARANDAASTLRARALNILADVTATTRPALQDALKKLNGDGEVSRLLALAAQCAGDERAAVRKAALQLLQRCIAADQRCLSDNNLGVLTSLCRDASIIVRSAAIAALGDLVLKWGHDNVLDAFLAGPLHQLSDPETKVQEQLVSLMQLMLVDRIRPHSKPRAPSGTGGTGAIGGTGTGETGASGAAGGTSETSDTGTNNGTEGNGPTIETSTTDGNCGTSAADVTGGTGEPSGTSETGVTVATNGTGSTSGNGVTGDTAASRARKPSGAELPWRFLAAIARHNMRRHLQKACALMAKSNNCISHRLVDVLSTHLSAEDDARDLQTLVLLTCVARHVPYTELGFVLDYYYRLIDGPRAQERDARLLPLTIELLGTWSRFLSASARGQLRAHLIRSLGAAIWGADSCRTSCAALAANLDPLNLQWATEIMHIYERRALEGGSVEEWLVAADLSLVAPEPPAPALLRLFLTAIENTPPVPDEVTRGVTVAGLGRLCVRSRAAAAAAAPPLARLLFTAAEPITARVNSLLALIDICTRYTCIVEPLLGSVCGCFAASAPAALRRTAASGLTRLLLGGFLRLRTPLYYRYCALLADEDPDVREPAEYYVTCCLTADAIYHHFVECVLHYNNDDTENIPFDARQLIYDVMLQRMSLVQKLNIQCRLAKEVLEHAADMCDEGDGDSELTPGLHAALLDTITLLCGPRMKLPRKPQNTGDDIDDLQERVTTNIVSHKMKRTVAEVLVPAVLRLSARMRSRGGQLNVYLVRIATDLLKDYRQEIEELIENDEELVERVRQFQETIGEEPTFGNTRNLVTSSTTHEPETPRASRRRPARSPRVRGPPAKRLLKV